MNRDSWITMLLLIAGVLLAFALFGAGALWKGRVQHKRPLSSRHGSSYGSIFVWAAVVAVTLVIADQPVAGQFKATNLVSDKTGVARYTDPNLLDAWGMAELPGGGFIVADALSGFVTFYSHNGTTLRSPVTVPPAPSLPPGTPGSPAGLVANPTSEFVISKDGKSAPALYLFSTLDGLICGWNPAVDPDNAVIMVDNSALSPFPASYSDLSMARNKAGQMILYATDSGISAAQSNNDVAMYDGNFHLLGTFTDPNAPSNMAAYSARPVNGKLYVNYAAFTPLAGVSWIFSIPKATCSVASQPILPVARWRPLGRLFALRTVSDGRVINC